MTNPYQAPRKRDAYERILELLRLDPGRSDRILAQVLHVQAGVSPLTANRIVRQGRFAVQH